MKILLRVLVAIIAVALVVGAIAYGIGSTLPVNHTVSVTGIIPAPPAKVFARIVDVANGATWRPEIKSVKVLPPNNGRDAWVEDVGHGQTMAFLAVATDAPSRREVTLDDPSATYGGTWLYELSPGPSSDQTTLTITETGYVRPPFYRFMMAHIMGPTYNLDHYMADMKVAASKY
jgi:uncharacterized protein YndB with AHSA1/START domain